MARLMCDSVRDPRRPSEILVRRAGIARRRRVQRCWVPRLVAGSGAHRLVDRRQPVGPERFRHRARPSMMAQIRGQELVDDRFIAGIEINRECHGYPFHLTAPVLQEVGVVEEHSGDSRVLRSASRVNLSHHAWSARGELRT